MTEISHTTYRGSEINLSLRENATESDNVTGSAKLRDLRQKGNVWAGSLVDQAKAGSHQNLAQEHC